MTRIFCNIAASAFFGMCAADLAEHMVFDQNTQAALTGVVGYLGAMTSDLCFRRR